MSDERGKDFFETLLVPFLLIEIQNSVRKNSRNKTTEHKIICKKLKEESNKNTVNEIDKIAVKRIAKNAGFRASCKYPAVIFFIETESPQFGHLRSKLDT